MKGVSLLKLIIIFYTSISLSTSQLCPCNTNGNTLQCDATNNSSVINTTSCSLNGTNSITIVYRGNVVLNLATSSVNSIFIKPFDSSATNILQISSINASTTRIEISIYLSSNPVTSTLFTSTCSITAPSSTLSINVIQTINDTSTFKIFDNSSSTKINVANYELIFDRNNSNSGSLYLPSLIFGLTTLTSITISGNNHLLVVDSLQMPTSISVNKLLIKNLRLYDQILYNIINLLEYSIEGCEYNETSKILFSTPSYNQSLIMKNNTPKSLTLPYCTTAFAQMGTLSSVTLIEPQLDSSCLKALNEKLASNARVSLSLGTYNTSDLANWAGHKPVFWYLTMGNLKNLSVLPLAFFNNFQALKQITLRGTFKLEKTDICIFIGINKPYQPENPFIILDSPAVDPNDWQNCALTYVTAINSYTTNNIRCPPDNSCQDCQRWANATAQCDLISYENSCPVRPERPQNVLTYNTSYLYYFFQNQVWSNGTTYPNGGISKEDSINIGAIIGAVCGLLIAIIVLILTIVLIRRYRRKDAAIKYIPSAPQPDYKPSADDYTHVSIATSKTSQSSRYALEKSFFPPMQPNDEIAPPLYTAPSEAAGSLSPYNAPSAPPASRDSVLTHATTHVYETVDS